MTQGTSLLCVDAGNTLVKWCVHDSGQKNFSDIAVLSNYPTAELKPFDEADAVLRALFSPLLSEGNSPIAAVLLCNVLGSDFEQAMLRLCEQHRIPLHVLSVNSKLPMRSAYESPFQLGKDRWAACLAVSQTSQSPVNLLVSFGTATTVDAVVNRSGWKHLGGFIVPGLHTMLDSLHVNTAELPQVELGKPLLSTESGFWPVNTQQAIEQGVGRLQAALIQSSADQLEQQYKQAPVVWFSGGYAPQMLSYFPQARLLENAVFKGLLFDYQCAGRVGS
jgi:type III pantothenate kinase